MMIKRLSPLFLAVFVLCTSACYRTTFISPPGYNLVRPEVTTLHASVLSEISGIAFHGRAFDTFYSINDEQGKLFIFTRANPKPVVSKFWRSGDYEDVTITGNKVVVLKSDGELYVFSHALTRNPEIEADSVTRVKVLPKSEYEGLYADSTGRLYVLCKHCHEEDPSKTNTIYTLVPDGAGSYRPDKTITLDVPAMRERSGDNKLRFNPSCLAQHPVTHEWFILSSVNKMLVTTDTAFHVTGAYDLKPNLFRQPEGIAFDAKGNLYITNEGKEDEIADLMLFSYNPQAQHKK